MELQFKNLLVGFLGQGLGFAPPAELVWYVLFIEFVTYAMLPLPLRWSVCAALLTAATHIVICSVPYQSSMVRKLTFAYRKVSICTCEHGKFNFSVIPYSIFQINQNSSMIEYFILHFILVFTSFSCGFIYLVGFSVYICQIVSFLPFIYIFLL